ncbi:hypothetical protein K488DRAFT_23524, partial [Vararia minispora EC-137]
DRALVLHTIPPEDSSKNTGVEKEKTAEPAPVPSSSKMPTAVQAISKLISVVEIIKRQYLASLVDTGGLVGLHQYNQLGCLEELEDHGAAAAVEMDEDMRAQEITELLSGTKNVRIKRTPYMRVTLSVHEIPSLAADDSPATAQPPAKRCLSKSAKGRLKKRLKK